MDYHIINNADYLDDYQKPLFFWTKGDILTFVDYLDNYVAALKRDYQTIVDYQTENNVQILDDNENMGIVYCEAELFGITSGKWDLPKYKFPNILFNNVIFCSAFFRKQDWEFVGGYKVIMKYGWEDYEFWLSLIELKR